MAAQPQSTEIVERRIVLALRMIELGGWVFPLASNAKEPFVRKSDGGGGFKDARPDPEMARTFLSNPGRLNYGVVFPEGSDIIVLDIDGGDRESRPRWVEEWQALYDRHGPPGLTYIVRTPSGGRHAYYRWRSDLYGPLPPGDETLGWTVRKPWKGYVVGPGSMVHGQAYEPVGLDGIADLSEAWSRAVLDEAAGKQRPVASSTRLTIKGPAAVATGHRHAYLRNQARYLVGLGLTGEALEAAVLDLNRQLPEPKPLEAVRRAIGEAEAKFEPDELDPETGTPIHSAQWHASTGRKNKREPRDIDLPFLSALAVSSMTPEVIDWAWSDYLAFGTIAEIVGPPKTGKTTFVFSLVRSYVEGTPFLDRATTGGPVVVLTEQGTTSLRAVLVRTGTTERTDIEILLHRETRGEAWGDVAAAAVRRCEEIGARLLVVDTLPAFAGLSGESENNAGDALEAMEPLLTAAAQGLAVLVSRHRRKGGATDIADEGRGSGAFSGTVDVILSLRRKEGGGRATVRVLAAASRFDETPEELFVELEDGHYVALGGTAAIEASEARDAILEQVQGTEGLTVSELVDLTGKSRQTLQRVLVDLVRTGDLERHGQGTRGKPLRYVFPTPGILSAQSPTPYGGEWNGGSGREANPGPGLVSVSCRSYAAHQPGHYRAPDGWRCRTCEENEA